ncbi:MAG: cytochrome d ubiquinol oxidase subunit II [Legionellaceae bacterium]|nr:cytochrome d ubiquinol oxidase subunit II [Legionellaceae bacterium]MBP9774537.1 cytochrome d ubiquinol oxidase subunit II [Legionellaceae bacterium]
MIDYETLRIVWWLLLGVLLIGFAVMDGFDLGAAILMPWLGKTDLERRVCINCIGPTWEGNQVWFILGGGAIFAAWPMLYAVSFSGFYLAMLWVLLALILRPVGFKYRSKLSNITWRLYWDRALFVGGFVPSLIFGVAIGNVLQGVPFHFDESLRPFYTGTFLELLNPFALLSGLLSVAMLSMHGAFFIHIKTQEQIQARAKTAGKFFALLTSLLFISGGLWLYLSGYGYKLNSIVMHAGPSNPLYKSVVYQTDAWFHNYQSMHVALLAPALGILLPLFACGLARFPKIAFLCSAGSIASIIATVGISMFPFMLPSSTHPNHSLLVWDSSSSQLTLSIMLIGTAIFLPIVLAYTTWVYRVLRGKVSEQNIIDNIDTAY